MPTERLQKCLDAGGVFALFALLQDWPQHELRALVADVESYAETADRGIDDKWKAEAFRLENFVNRKWAQALDQARDDAHMQVLAVASEIISVAMYYLDDNRETPDA